LGCRRFCLLSARHHLLHPRRTYRFWQQRGGNIAFLLQHTLLARNRVFRCAAGVETPAAYLVARARGAILSRLSAPTESLPAFFVWTLGLGAASSLLDFLLGKRRRHQLERV